MSKMGVTKRLLPQTEGTPFPRRKPAPTLQGLHSCGASLLTRLAILFPTLAPRNSCSNKVKALVGCGAELQPISAASGELGKDLRISQSNHTYHSAWKL